MGRPRIASLAVGLLACLLVGCGGLLPVGGRAPLAFTALRAAADFDLDRDGSPEILAIRPIPGLGQAGPRGNRATIVLLVEARLWDEPGPEGGPSIRPAIQQYVADLAAEGQGVLAATARLYAGKRHKDGRIVLALRRYLAAVRERAPWLRAAVLVGDFPEAYIVRQHFWKKHGKVTLHAKKPNEKKLADVHYWACVPEPVADRADIVLADLDGRWDRVYREASAKIPYFIAAFAKGTGDANQGTTDLYETGTHTFEDYFYVHDGRWRSVEAGKGGRCFERLGPLNDECTDDDLRQLNPMARPEIYIARINARHVGVELRRDVVGTKGEHLFDKDGRPQTVTFADEKRVPHVRSLWARDEAMERRLLVEFFRRNHRFRAGELKDARKPACLTTRSR